MKRIRYEVQLRKKLAYPKGLWWVLRNGRRESGGRRKADTIKWAVRLAREDLQAGNLSQLVIKRRDGTIQDERTYGHDPRRTKG